jgi:AmmeMemoRadiSam system protein B
VPDETDRRYYFIWDKLGLSAAPCRVTVGELMFLDLFDGKRTLREIQELAMRQSDGRIIPLESFTRLADKMEEALFLDGPRFRERLADPIREPSCLGSYEADPDALRSQLMGYFTGARGPGLPGARTPDGTLCAALIPHIDYCRGGFSYAWGFKEVFERTNAGLFVIIGTSHYSTHRFTLTRKDFKTPLGIARTDQAHIDRLVTHYGDGLFDDEIAHLPEHSIELEVVFLQHYYDARRPIRIVPLLVGPFHDCVQTGHEPCSRADIGRMIVALRRAEQEAGEPICYIISGDLAHIGPEFGDPERLEPAVLERSRRQDERLCGAAEAVDPEAYFNIVADEADGRRICGMPPTYTLLEAIRPRRGRVLHYDQYVHPRGAQSVSFASVAFYR